MDSFSLYRCQSGKPHLELTLEISGKVKRWLIPNTSFIKNSVKKLAVEMPDEEIISQRKAEERLSLIEKGDIELKYLGKRKIVFKPVQTNMEIDDFVLLIPSWGARTEKRIWVLIPS